MSPLANAVGLINDHEIDRITEFEEVIDLPTARARAVEPAE